MGMRESVWKQRRVLIAIALGLAWMGMTAAARAQLVISTGSTTGMNCTPALCTATQPQAALNVATLTKLLKTNSVTVKNPFGTPIQVNAAIAWARNTVLTLQTLDTVTVSAPIKVNGKGGVNFIANADIDGPYVVFMPGGAVTYLHPAGVLIMNNQRFILVRDIKDLVHQIAVNPKGNYALANDYAANADGIYTHAPVNQMFGGVFEGLGHTISKLTIASKENGASVGLFSTTDVNAFPRVRDISLVAVSIKGGAGSSTGALIGNNSNAPVSRVFVSGVVSAPKGRAGGISGTSGAGLYSQCMSAANVTGNIAGGLVGYLYGAFIQNSMATGAVTSHTGTDFPIAGGLIGEVLGGGPMESYSTGAVSGASDAIGGLVGSNLEGTYIDNYWDTTTSGTTTGCGGYSCGSNVTGLTTAQLQAGLPSGFGGYIWGERSDINNGMPYLLAVPPR